MKRRILSLLLALVLLVGLTPPVRAAAGSQDSPLVSESFVRRWFDDLCSEILEQVQEAFEALETRLFPEDTSPVAVQNRALELPMQAMAVFPEGSSFTLLTGSVKTIIAEGQLIDATLGQAMDPEAKLIPEHLYIVAENSRVELTAWEDSLLRCSGHGEVIPYAPDAEPSASPSPTPTPTLVPVVPTPVPITPTTVPVTPSPEIAVTMTPLPTNPPVTPVPTQAPRPTSQPPMTMQPDPWYNPYGNPDTAQPMQDLPVTPVPTPQPSPTPTPSPSPSPTPAPTPSPEPSPDLRPSDLPFKDVSSSAWFYDELRCVYNAQVFGGTGKTKFSPSDDLTYAQAITAAARLHQLLDQEEITLRNHWWPWTWYKSYRRYAIAEGLIGPEYGDYSRKQMNAPISGGQLLELFTPLFDLLEPEDINEVSPEQLDLPEGEEAPEALVSLYRWGILPTDGHVRPGEVFRVNLAAPVKRSDAAVLLARLLDADFRLSFPEPEPPEETEPVPQASPEP